jgi:glycosyltransferase involved in cell wall biosynthesis
LDSGILKKLKDSLGERIVIKNGSVISEEDMSKFYQESVAVWLGYSYSTQSGVLATCFQNATPVVATNIPGFSQDVISGVNGELLNNMTPEEIDRAYTAISKNVISYSQNAFSSFQKRYYYKNYAKTLTSFVSEMLSK